MKITTSGAANRPADYDRNPLFVSTTSNQTPTVAPHISTQAFSYTVPTGRKARCSNPFVFLMRVGAPTSSGLVNMYIAVGGFVYAYLDYVNNVVGASALNAPGGEFYLLAGQILWAFSTDNSTGGSINYAWTVATLEFDA